MLATDNEEGFRGKPSLTIVIKLSVFLLLFLIIEALSQHFVTSDTLRERICLSEIEVDHLRTKDTLHSKAHASVSTDDMLGRMPELGMIRRGAFAMEPTIRGYSTSQINVNIDGMRIHGACTDKMDPATSYVEPINLDHIQVQTQADASRYGSSTGGTLYLGLRQPIINRDKPVSIQYTTGYGSNAQAWNQTGALNLSKSKSALRISGVYRQAQPYVAGGGERILYSGYGKYNVMLSAKHLVTNCSYLKADVLIDEGRNIGYPALLMDVSRAQSQVYALEHFYGPCIGNLQHVKTKIYFNNVHHIMDDSKRPNVSIRMDMPGWSNTIGTFAELAWSIHPKHYLQIRPEWVRHYSKAEMTMYPSQGAAMYMLTWPDNVRWQLGSFVQYSYTANSNNKVDFSVRVDEVRNQVFSEFGIRQMEVLLQSQDAKPIHWSLHLGALWEHQWSSKLRFSYSISYNERPPGATELFGFFIYNVLDGYDLIGNPKLRTEKSVRNSVTCLWYSSIFQLQTSVYYDKINDFIIGRTLSSDFSPMTLGANGVRMFVNHSSGNMAGFESKILAKVVKNIQFNHTLRYQKGWFDDGSNIPLIAPLRSINTLKYGSNSRSIVLESEWSAWRRRVNQEYGEKSTPSFVVVHLRANYPIFIKTHKLQLGVGVENMLDTKYREHLDWGGIPRPGRNIYANLSYAW